MKEKLMKALDILWETLYFLIITYTLHSMYTSFRIHWYAIPFLAANIFAIGRYRDKIIKITGSRLVASIALIVCLAVFACLAYFFGYIHGEFVSFPTP